MNKTTPKLKLSRVMRGIYLDYPNGVSVRLQAIWNRDEGRKWEVEWRGVSGMFGTPVTRREKFDTKAECCAWAQDILDGLS